ncbi:snake venom 5'-nucleotidase-like [Ixodes scapularis]|uniref:snake venom 5'-nucleotidase-like n=1 Tax=Ixodes scapularis TaxID=6945 RepID=UPI001A9E2594|nr:snake venom 5'-nucleotidase-like [Ixodes scapularis]
MTKLQLLCAVFFGILRMSYSEEVDGFKLTVLHTNDIHAHFEESNKYGGRCELSDKKKKKCVGGVARLLTKVKEIKASNNHTLFMNAGDIYQGTMWFTLLKDEVVSVVMANMKYDVMCLGNHEFDNGPEGLAPFLKKMKKAKVPVVSSNTDFTRTSSLKDLELPKSHVFVLNGTKVGVIGAVTPETRSLSKPGNVVFYDDLGSIRNEAINLTKQGITVIVALTHSGYERDLEIAASVPQVDIVVGGHTNTFLYSGEGYPRENKPEGPYPTVVNRTDGSVALVTQDFWFGKFLGFLEVIFDTQGRVKSWSGNPILMDSSIEEDECMVRVLRPFAEKIANASKTRVGSSKVLLEQDNNVCRIQECNLGNAIADSFFEYYANEETQDKELWSNVNGAFVNGGSTRAPLPQSDNILYQDILNALPFGSQLTVLSLTGTKLREIFEHSVKTYSLTARPGRFLQVSGIRVTYNLSRESGSRVQSLKILGTRCKVPVYEDVSNESTYSVVTIDYIAKGGDGFPIDASVNSTTKGVVDYEAFVDYVRKMSPLKTPEEGRIEIVGMPPEARVLHDPDRWGVTYEI